MNTGVDVNSDVWNERFIQFTGEETSSVLWKDSGIDKWKTFWSRLSFVQNELKAFTMKSDLLTMSKIVYKHNNQMRRDKSFQFFKKVVTISKRFFYMDLFHVINKYQNIIGKFQRRNSSFSNNVIIPSKEFTIYIIERNLGAAKLLAKVLFYSQEAFKYLDAHMRLGYFVSFNLYAIAAVSNVWSQMKRMYETLKTLYALMYEVLTNMYNSKEECYPFSLDVWLDADLHWLYPEKSWEMIESRKVKKENLNEENIESSNDVDPETTATATILNGVSDDVREIVLPMDIGAPLSPNSVEKLRKTSRKKDSLLEIKNRQLTNIHFVLSDEKDELDASERCIMGNSDIVETLNKTNVKQTSIIACTKTSIVGHHTKEKQDSNSDIVANLCKDSCSVKNKVAIDPENISSPVQSHVIHNKNGKISLNTICKICGLCLRSYKPSLNTIALRTPLQRYSLKYIHWLLPFYKRRRTLRQLKFFVRHSLLHTKNYKQTATLIFSKYSISRTYIKKKK